MKRIATLVFALLFCGTLFAAEDDIQNDFQTAQSLLNRGQFAAVESLVQEKLQQTDVAEIDKIRLATILVQSYSQQLLVAAPAQRPPIVRRIETLETTLLTPSVDSDLVLAKITFRLQCSMAYRSLGDYQRLEADIASETNKRTAYQSAQSTLLDALERLKKCQQELQAFRQRVGINATPQLTREMLASEYSIAMQQGIARKSLALTFTAEADRNFELREAAEALSVLASKDSTDSVIIQCKIEKASCHRLCGELDKCAAILTPLLNNPEYRLSAEAEWIRLQIAAGNIAEMRRRYATDREESRQYPDFDLARLELFLANDPDQHIRPEVATADRLRQTLGQRSPYWRQRAAMTESALTLGNTDLVSAETLAMRAENRFKENRFAESAQLYEEAAAKADTNRQADNMFRYNLHAILAWEKVLEHAPDAEKTEHRKRLIPLLRNLSVQNPNYVQAVDLHLRAIDLQGEIGLSSVESQNEYLTLIKEHMATWKESPKMSPLRRLSVGVLERLERTDEAAALLPLLDLEQIATLSPEMQRQRVRQLDTEGKTQEAVDILTVLLKQKREPATLRLMAEIRSRQTDVASLESARILWTELAESVPKNSETWWIAREGIFDVYFKLNRQEEAKKFFDMLRTLYPDLGGAERKERLIKRFETN
jgi:tetratricopeptide (TPR) repeat protein